MSISKSVKVFGALVVIVTFVGVSFAQRRSNPETVIVRVTCDPTVARDAVDVWGTGNEFTAMQRAKRYGFGWVKTRKEVVRLNQ